MTKFKAFVPSNDDGVLRVVILGRKSKPNPLNENEAIEASLADAESNIRARHEGPIEFTPLGEQISGMKVDRETLHQTWRMIQAGQVDVVATEDIGRLFRNIRHMYAFVQDCIDAEVRFVAVHDNLDTADEDWETAMSIAAMRHGFAVTDARRRIKRSAKFAFKKGGSVGKIKFGYAKLNREEAKSGLFGPIGLRIRKLPELTATIREMLSWVLSTTPFYSWDDMADMANTKGIPTGEFCKRGKWTGPVFQSFISDRILGGYRSFGATVSRQILGTGERETKRNPDGPEFSHHPELAHLTPEEFEELHRVLAERYEPREDRGKKHKRHKVPRGKSIFPAQHCVCIGCRDRMYAYDGNNVKCSNSGKGSLDRCWNHLQVNMEQARLKVIPWVVQQLDQFPEFRGLVVDFCWEAIEKLRYGGNQEGQLIEQKIAGYERQANNFTNAIANGVTYVKVIEQLKQVEEKLATAQQQLAKHNAKLEAACQLPFPDRQKVSDELVNAMIAIARTSFEFADLMKRLLPRFEIVPIQAINSTLVRPRAYVTLVVDLAKTGEASADVRQFEGVIDLFDPPAEITNFAACARARLRNPEATLRELGRELGLGYMTVKRSLDLTKHLAGGASNEVYRELRSPPQNASRWRGHDTPVSTHVSSLDDRNDAAANGPNQMSVLD